MEAEYTGVVGGLLVQNQDVVKESPADWQVVTKRQPTETEATALEFAWKAIKYVKSNGIIVTNDHMTLGVGPGGIREDRALITQDMSRFYPHIFVE